MRLLSMLLTVGMGWSLTHCTDPKLGQKTPNSLNDANQGVRSEDEDVAVISPIIHAKDIEQRPTKQALFYYAIDTADPFMQLSVNHEILSLLKVCNPEIKANWFIAINSHFTAHPEQPYYYCYEGKLNKGKWPGYLHLNEMVEKISDSDFDSKDISKNPEVSYGEFFSKPKDAPDDYELPDIQLPLILAPTGLDGPRELRRFYKHYPLASLPLLKNIWLFVNQKVFNHKEFTVHTHFKSHGTGNLILTGLDGDTLRAKTEEQKKLWQEKSDARRTKGLEVLELPTFEYGYVGFKKFSDAEQKLIDAYGFGTVCDGQCLAEIQANTTRVMQEGGAGLGERDARLSAQRARLGVEFASKGLGMNSVSKGGLGAEDEGETKLTERNYFGVSFHDFFSYLNINQFLRATGIDNLGWDLSVNPGFGVLESCDSGKEPRRDFDLPEGGSPPFLGWFAASGGLWFRNFDWDTVFKKIHDSNWATLESFNYIVEWSSSIPNYVKRTPSQLKIVNQCSTPLYVGMGREESRQLLPGEKPEPYATSTSGWWVINANSTSTPAYGNAKWLRINRAGFINEALVPNHRTTRKLCANYSGHNFTIGLEEDYDSTCKTKGGILLDGYEEIYSWDKEVVVKDCQWKVKICNNTTTPSYAVIDAAFAYYDAFAVEGKKGGWVSKGWYRIKQGLGEAGCATFGPFDKPYVFLRSLNSEGKEVTWKDSAADDEKSRKFCMHLRDKFTFVNEPCDGDDKDKRKQTFWQVPDIEYSPGGEYSFSAGG